MYVMREWSRSAHGDGAEAAQMLRFDAVHPEMVTFSPFMVK